MDKLILIAVTTILCSIMDTHPQGAAVQWGLKAGANYALFWDHLETQSNTGFEYSGKFRFLWEAWSTFSFLSD